MKKIFITISMFWIFAACSGKDAISTIFQSTQTIANGVEHEHIQSSNQNIHIYTIDLYNWVTKIGVIQGKDRWAAGLETLGSMVKRHQPMLAVNGDYFSWAPPAQGSQVINGECFRFHPGRSSLVIEETQSGWYSVWIGRITGGKWPEGKERIYSCNKKFKQVISGGPQFIVNGKEVWQPGPYSSESERQSLFRKGLRNINGDSHFGQESDGWKNTPYPQTAVGISSTNKLIIITCDGKNVKNRYKGCSLIGDISRLMLQRSVTTALKLDSGGSVTNYLNGRLLNFPSESSNGTVERPIANALVLYK